MEEKVKKIKQSFRLLMNGVTAQSLRDKGLEYHLNWGANLLHLRDLASEYEKDMNLAIALWKEDVRECKIMAILLMPPAQFSSDMAMLWIEQLRSQEIAELLAHNLLQHTSYASDLAFQLLSYDEEIRRILGFNLIGCLFRKKMEPNDRDINEFIDQAVAALSESSVPLRHSALVAVQRFAELSEMHRAVAVGALKPLDLDYML